MKPDDRLTYLEVFLSAATSAAEPVDWDDRRTFGYIIMLTLGTYDTIRYDSRV